MSFQLINEQQGILSPVTFAEGSEAEIEETAGDH